MNVQTHLFSLA